ncbi:glucose dehydrogenase [FAD, quinone]-like [Ischnura elegans]|uniref:glucose dehydrogenase [FAD, quinone]-like n=1 Tax=Ischnura elegans TaxID=197161 RepID=UPI001ED8AFE7|nr:glucose dehydrogenase [FAD, quinone]-like [Ischnura elegans]XP_046388278.1 glucose dehydrogenase [FAD, quinone]-like [Ischnura elegans]
MCLHQVFLCLYSAGIAVLTTFFYCCYVYNDIVKGYFDHQENVTAFDFIVVGAGTAGVIVASRLAENPSHQVLLLEAGDESNFLLDIPAFAPLLQLSHYDWKYVTEPQKNACLGLENNSSRWPRGKVVGGSSRLNYALYVRGHRQDFDSWASDGNEGWSYSDVLPYFKKSEKQSGEFKHDSIYHSTEGEWFVSDAPSVSVMAEEIIAAAKELGMERIDVNNGGKGVGFMLAQANLEKGARCSAETAMLKKVNKQSNLKVIANARVEKILFENYNKAKGVTYSKMGKKYLAKVAKEIILSAGAIETPKLLMISGIGPKDHLKSLEIPALLDLPVGKNLQDHITTGTDLVFLNETLVSLTSFASPLAAAQYLSEGKGPWVTLACETIGFLHSSLSDSKIEAPDLQIMTAPFGLTFDGGSHLRNAVGISNEMWTKYFQPLVDQPVASIMPVLLKPKSRGEILLRSSKPLDPPKINPQYFSHPDDIQVLIDGLKFVTRILDTKVMTDFGAQLNKNMLPGCESYVFGSDEYWKCYTEHITLTSYHPVGTCKMGPRGDKTAVVDSHLRVHGVQNLRVIDASIMPTIVTANTNAATMMIGEKGADMIKAAWQLEDEVCKPSESNTCPLGF